MSRPVRASAAGTAALAKRGNAASFYRPAWDGLMLASIGLGSYLGQPDEATDASYTAAARRYLLLGGNLIDTAVNYRLQRSERALGVALRAAFEAGQAARGEVVVCTKGGYLSFDSDWPADPDQWAYDTFVATGIVAPADIVEEHCMAPAYLRHEIAQSLRNLQLECLDLYYLHNPEGQRPVVGDDEFRTRLREAFATLEVAVAQGQIAAYGTATWNGYRARPQAPDYLSLAEVIDIARDVSGDRHHFRAIQLPLNFQMLEALARSNQPGRRGLAPTLAVAAEHNVSVIASASLLQGRVLGRLPASLKARFTPRLTDAQRGLQFVRSTPGVTSALTGMSRVAHVDENLELRHVEPMTTEAYKAIFADERGSG